MRVEERAKFEVNTLNPHKLPPGHAGVFERLSAEYV